MLCGSESLIFLYIYAPSYDTIDSSVNSLIIYFSVYLICSYSRNVQYTDSSLYKASVLNYLDKNEGRHMAGRWLASHIFYEGNKQPLTSYIIYTGCVKYLRTNIVAFLKL